MATSRMECLRYLKVRAYVCLVWNFHGKRTIQVAIEFVQQQQQQSCASAPYTSVELSKKAAKQTK